MKCPKCKSTNLAVLASRKQDYQTFNHRYVICKDCRVTFQTVENIIPGTIVELPELFMNDNILDKKEPKNS